MTTAMVARGMITTRTREHVLCTGSIIVNARGNGPAGIYVDEVVLCVWLSQGVQIFLEAVFTAGSLGVQICEEKSKFAV